MSVRWVEKSESRSLGAHQALSFRGLRVNEAGDRHCTVGLALGDERAPCVVTRVTAHRFESASVVRLDSSRADSNVVNHATVPNVRRIASLEWRAAP